MTESEFRQLPNRKIKFITYTGKVHVGGNFTDYSEGTEKFYIITNPNVSESLTLEDKINKGILIPIKPSIIEEAIVIQ